MEYYSNARSGSQHGELPNDTTTLSSTSRVTWEGVQRCGYYSSSGVTFCSQIASNAASLVSSKQPPPPNDLYPERNELKIPVGNIDVV